VDILKRILKQNDMPEDEIHPEDKLIQGTIIQLNYDRGFGFITSAGVSRLILRLRPLLHLLWPRGREIRGILKKESLYL
jgi:hypothetical protein